MPGATGVVVVLRRTELATGYTPQVRDWLASDGQVYKLADTASRDGATVLGLVLEVTATVVRMVLVGSFVPLKALGTLAELRGLASPLAFLSATGRIGDQPSGSFVRRLFTVPIPLQLLTDSHLDSIYVQIECDSPWLSPAP